MYIIKNINHIIKKIQTNLSKSGGTVDDEDVGCDIELGRELYDPNAA